MLMFFYFLNSNVNIFLYFNFVSYYYLVIVKLFSSSSVFLLISEVVTKFRVFQSLDVYLNLIIVNNIAEILLFIIFLPFLNFIFIALFGSFFQGDAVRKLSLLFMLLSFFFSIFFLIYFFVNSCFCIISLGNWVTLSGVSSVRWVFLFDTLSLLMCCTVVFVSFLVHIFSLKYMGGDPCLFRFLSYLSLFTFFMLFLVTSGNFLQFFLGWEGVGLCSYLLIGFWYHRVEANFAALKAVFINKIGDVFLFSGVILVFLVFGSLQFDVVFSLIPFYKDVVLINAFFSVTCLDIISVCFFIAAVGKSAQLGLHTWLPDAMEGPTPVSALIHAATMVTAGIFLLIRCSWFFVYVPYLNGFMVLWGLGTILFAGFVASVQMDIKKVIAYSTCSQLGFMLVSCGLGSYVEALGHLIGHAFFKASLFLAAGFLIYNLHDEQDMRKMGYFTKIRGFSLIFVYFSVLISSLGLLGFVGFTGYFTKEPIIFSSYYSYLLLFEKLGFSVFFLDFFFFIGLFLTSFYSVRLLCMVFWGGSFQTSTLLFTGLFINNSVNLIFVFCIFCLAFVSVIFGLGLYSSWFGFFSPIFYNSIFSFYNYFFSEYIFFSIFSFTTHLFFFEFSVLPFFFFSLQPVYFIFCYNFSIYWLPSFCMLLGFIVGFIIQNTKFGKSSINVQICPIHYHGYRYDFRLNGDQIIYLLFFLVCDNFYDLFVFLSILCTNFIKLLFIFLLLFLMLIFVSLQCFYYIFLFLIICLIIGLSNVVVFVLSCKLYIYFNSFYFFHKLFSCKFYIDLIYLRILTFFYDISIQKFYKNLDKGIFEYLGPTGLGFILNRVKVGFLVFHGGSFLFYLKILLYSFLFIFCIENFCALYVFA